MRFLAICVSLDPFRREIIPGTKSRSMHQKYPTTTLVGSVRDDTKNIREMIVARYATALPGT